MGHGPVVKMAKSVEYNHTKNPNMNIGKLFLLILLISLCFYIYVTKRLFWDSPAETSNDVGYESNGNEAHDFATHNMDLEDLEDCELSECEQQCAVSIVVTDPDELTFIQIGETRKHSMASVDYSVVLVALEIGKCEIKSTYTCEKSTCDLESTLNQYAQILEVSTPVVGVMKPGLLTNSLIGKLKDKLEWYLPTFDIDEKKIEDLNLVAFSAFYGMQFSGEFRGTKESTLSWSTTLNQGILRKANLSDVPSLSWETLPKYEEGNDPFHWKPQHCEPKWTVAVIIPVKNREKNLRILIKHLFPFLQQQKIAFSIYVMDQSADLVFNKGRLMNLGYLEARHRHDYDCYVFHDVDMLPENMCNLYACGPQPRHLHVTVASGDQNYQLTYKYLIGGGLILNERQMTMTNGYPIHMWGWTGEYDSMYFRIHFSDLSITRYPVQIGRYQEIEYTEIPKSGRSEREALINGLCRGFDGISTLNSSLYNIVGVDRTQWYTRIRVSFPGAPGNVRGHWKQQSEKLLQECEPSLSVDLKAQFYHVLHPS